MRQRPPRSTRTDTRFPNTTLIRSCGDLRLDAGVVSQFVDALLPDHGRIHVGYEDVRSEEHTSELQSLMRISYAVFSLRQKPTSMDYYPSHPPGICKS